jgi:hypothetical protein
MNDFQAKTTFDITKCRTLRRGQTDLFDCLAEKQYLICGHALYYGYGLSRDTAVNPSQSERLE